MASTMPMVPLADCKNLLDPACFPPICTVAAWILFDHLVKIDVVA